VQGPDPNEGQEVECTEDAVEGGRAQDRGAIAEVAREEAGGGKLRDGRHLCGRGSTLELGKGEDAQLSIHASLCLQLGGEPERDGRVPPVEGATPEERRALVVTRIRHDALPQEEQNAAVAVLTLDAGPAELDEILLGVPCERAQVELARRVPATARRRGLEDLHAIGPNHGAGGEVLDKEVLALKVVLVLVATGEVRVGQPLAELEVEHLEAQSAGGVEVLHGPCEAQPVRAAHLVQVGDAVDIGQQAATAVEEPRGHRGRSEGEINAHDASIGPGGEAVPPVRCP
jgi:hypothetical protein